MMQPRPMGDQRLLLNDFLLGSLYVGCERSNVPENKTKVSNYVNLTAFLSLYYIPVYIDDEI